MNSEQQLFYHEQQVRELRRENTRLRKRVQETGRHARRVEQAYKDALLLAEWRTVAIIPSRRYARYHKMSQRRWQNATALLRLARVLEGSRVWRVTDLTLIEERLSAARNRALEQPDRYAARLNRHAKHDTGHRDS